MIQKINSFNKIILMKERVQSQRKMSKSSTAVKLPKIQKQIDKEIGKTSENKKRANQGKLGSSIKLKKKQQKFVEGEDLNKPDQQVSALAYAVYDQNLTTIIEYKGDEKKEIASVTKFMNLYAGYRLSEKFKINPRTTYFRVSTNAGNAFGTSAELDPKEWATIEDLYYGLMLPSGNDAALVLSQNFGAILFYQKKGQSKVIAEIKSLDVTDDGLSLKHYTELFIKYMNHLSVQIGLTNTLYMNPHGLDCKEAYSTTKDVAIIMKKIVQIPQLAKVIGTRQYFARLKFGSGKKEVTNFRQGDWMNTNRMLWKRGYLGGKTGQTQGAGNCLANIYEEGGKKYYIVVLGSKGRQDRFRDTEKLVQKYIVARINA